MFAEKQGLEVLMDMLTEPKGYGAVLQKQAAGGW